MTEFPKLSGKLYRVKVPLLATLTAVDYKFGIRLNTYVDEFGRSGNDKKRNQEWCTVLYKLDKIIEVYEQGFPIHMTNRDELSKMYKELDLYVQNMADMVNKSINGGAMFDKRVYVIEKFVNEIFGNNRGTILKNTYNARVLGITSGVMETIDSKAVNQALSRVSIPKVIKPTNSSNPFDHPTPEQRTASIGGNNLSNNKLPTVDPYADVYNNIPTYQPRFFNQNFNQ